MGLEDTCEAGTISVKKDLRGCEQLSIRFGQSAISTFWFWGYLSICWVIVIGITWDGSGFPKF